MFRRSSALSVVFGVSLVFGVLLTVGTAEETSCV